MKKLDNIIKISSLIIYLIYLIITFNIFEVKDGEELFLIAIGIPVITLLITNIIGLILHRFNIGIKTNLFSNIIDNHITPTYKFIDKGINYSEIKKYEVKYELYDTILLLIAPYLHFFKFKQQLCTDVMEIDMDDYNKIINEELTPKEIYENAELIYKEEYFKELSEDAKRIQRQERINSQYLNNFK